MQNVNMKIYNYIDGFQIRLYNNPIKKDYTKIEEETEKSSTPEKENNPYPLSDEEIEDKKSRSLKSAKSRSINRIYEIARSNHWDWFITMTFDPAKVDSFNYNEVVKRLKRQIDYIRKTYAPNLKYIIIPELHLSGRYHFHGMIADIGTIEMLDSGIRDKHGHKIYNIKQFKLGFTTASKIKDNARVSGYISKYITNQVCVVSQGKKRYWHSKNLEEVKIAEHNIPQEEIEDFIESLGGQIVHVSKKRCIEAHRSVIYIEVKTKSENAEACQV
ncbi:MAG: hypothetical protein LBC96_04535 [Lachnospiraceae bacterium]|jgi:hypothetical protein|nr:hypothetical protein [Lachnospiraceae bacterium]